MSTISSDADGLKEIGLRRTTTNVIDNSCTRHLIMRYFVSGLFRRWHLVHQQGYKAVISFGSEEDAQKILLLKNLNRLSVLTKINGI